MAVQFADKALDEWLTEEIKLVVNDSSEAAGYCTYVKLKTLQDVQKQLHAFWGSALEPKE